MRTSKGTTARSWNNRTPMTRLPCSESSSSRSDINFTTIAVLLMAMAPDSASAVRHSIVHSEGAVTVRNTDPRVTTMMVIPTWKSPSPKTCRRIARNFGRLNSRPMTNIRNTTPNSPKCRMSSAFLANASA